MTCSTRSTRPSTSTSQRRATRRSPTGRARDDHRRRRAPGTRRQRRHHQRGRPARPTRTSPSGSRPPAARPVTVDYATADDTATAPADYTAHQRHAELHTRADLQDDHRPGQRRPARRGDETYFLNLSGAVNATITDRPGPRHDHRQRPAAGALRQRRHGHRGRRRHGRRDLHGQPQRPERPRGDGRLRDGERHGDRARGLHRGSGDSRLHRRPDDEDGRRVRRR